MLGRSAGLPAAALNRHRADRQAIRRWRRPIVLLSDGQAARVSLGIGACPGNRGDLLVSLEIKIAKNLSEEERGLIEKFKALRLARRA